MAGFQDIKNWLHNAFPFSPSQAGGATQPSEKLLELSRRTGDLTDRYFQVQVFDTENIPAEGGALMVSNHGFLMIESVVLHNVVLRNTNRALRPVVAHLIWDIPLYNHFVAAVGGIRGDQDTVVSLLKADELVLIYPGGVREAAKGSRDREKLFWEGRRGFVRAALRAGKPIIPTAINGADDVYIRTGQKMAGLGKLLGDKDAAIPFFVGLGLLPLPAPLTFKFGKPIPMDWGPEAADDDAVVDILHQRVREAVEALLADDRREVPPVTP